MAARPVILILGAGPRIGASVAEKFASSGYQVAIASRSGIGTNDANGFLSLKADFTKPDSIPALFDAVRTEFSNSPSVIVYNAGALTNPPDQDSVLSVPVESVTGDFIVNTISAYVAAQQAILGWETLPKETKKTFIFTGNITNVQIVPMPMMLNIGIGKSASAFWIGLADAMYSARGFRFFYADERTVKGKLKGIQLDGAAHGEFYEKLAKHDGDIPWHATFVKGEGYIDFK